MEGTSVLGAYVDSNAASHCWPGDAGDNNRQERREDCREAREERREHDNFFAFDHNHGIDGCCHEDFEFDEEEVLDLDFGFVPWYFFIEEIDVDCDGVNDRWDWSIDDECEVEVEFVAFD